MIHNIEKYAQKDHKKTHRNDTKKLQTNNF